jgi:tetratricopeptide (TPR) repeat protein
MKRITLVIALWAVFAATGNAQKNDTEQQLIKEANELFDRQEFLKAFPLYSQLVSLYPQDPVYNYKFGTCAIYGQPDKTQAIKHLNFATKKNVEDPMAWYYLGKACHLNYQFKDALEAYKTFNQKVDPKLATRYNTSREMEMCTYGTGLLANMKDVVVINKVESDRENFFRYFNVEDVGGKILTVPTELRSKLDEKDTEPGIMFYPDNSTTI